MLRHKDFSTTQAVLWKKMSCRSTFALRKIRDSTLVLSIYVETESKIREQC